MSSESWPPPLKAWVQKTMSEMTPSNKEEASKEMRQVIADAYSSKTLWTTDWNAIQLKCLQQKPLAEMGALPWQNVLKANGLKRKNHDTPVSNKKVKKSANLSANFDKYERKATAKALDHHDQVAINRRAQRFQREHDIERQKSSGSYIHASQSSRSHLFDSSRSASPYTRRVDEPEDASGMDWDKHSLVGTNTNIFKNYLRLTSEVKPEQVRPYHILRQTLEAVKTHWRDNNDYHWVCNQFKSMRQDLVVQRTKNEFTVQVYEIHARMALQVSDMVEYNACQGMLKQLYELGIPGKREEFTAYRVLMLLHGLNKSELNLFVGQLTPQERSSSAIKHALDVQRAMALGNYHAFFVLYLSAPNMGGYIMDHFVPRERVKALITMSKAYKTVTTKFLDKELGFDDLPSTSAFLDEHQVNSYTNPNAQVDERTIDCKPLCGHLEKLFEERYRKVVIKGAV